MAICLLVVPDVLLSGLPRLGRGTRTTLATLWVGAATIALLAGAWRVSGRGSRV
jgi:hypothetical protein